MNLRVIGVGVAVIALAMAALFYAGVRSGKRKLRLEQNSAQLDTNSRLIDSAAARRDTAERHTAATLEARAPIVTQRAAARARVSVKDSAVSIDSGPPVVVPPAVIALIRSDDALILHDSVSISRLQTENQTLRVERDQWKHRAELLEQRADLVKPSRFGFKSGVAAGAGVVVVVLFTAASLLSR